MPITVTIDPLLKDPLIDWLDQQISDHIGTQDDYAGACMHLRAQLARS